MTAGLAKDLDIINTFGLPLLTHSSAALEAPSTPMSQAMSQASPKPIPISLQKRISKTKICIHNLSGRCSRGARCSFAHSEHELKAPPDLYKTRLCDHFTSNGICPKGESCRFAHGDGELRSTAEFFKTSLCPYYQSGIRCPVGEKCRWAHGFNEIRQRGSSLDTTTYPSPTLQRPPSMPALLGHLPLTKLYGSPQQQMHPPPPPPKPHISRSESGMTPLKLREHRWRQLAEDYKMALERERTLTDGLLLDAEGQTNSHAPLLPNLHPGAPDQSPSMSEAESAGSDPFYERWASMACKFGNKDSTEASFKPYGSSLRNFNSLGNFSSLGNLTSFFSSTPGSSEDSGPSPVAQLFEDVMQAKQRTLSYPTSMFSSDFSTTDPALLEWDSLNGY